MNERAFTGLRGPRALLRMVPMAVAGHLGSPDTSGQVRAGLCGALVARCEASVVVVVVVVVKFCGRPSSKAWGVTRSHETSPCSGGLPRALVASSLSSLRLSAAVCGTTGRDVRGGGHRHAHRAKAWQFRLLPLGLPSTALA